MRHAAVNTTRANTGLRTRLLLLAFFASCCTPGTLCCSDVMLSNTSRIDAIVSGRHLDWFPLNSMSLDMVTVPAGSPVVYLPDAGCSSSPHQEAALQPYKTAKYGYVGYTTGLSAIRGAIQANCPDSPLSRMWFGTVFDGMNTEGLSAAFLTQRDAPEPSMLPQQQQQQQQQQQGSSAPGATSADTVPAVPLVYSDIVPLVLSNFKSVAELMQSVTPERFVFGKSEMWVAAEKQVMGGKNAPVLHLTVHDAQGETAVLEFIEGADGITSFHILPNPGGVTTNAPRLEEQLEFASEFRVNSAAEHPGALLLPGHCTGPGVNGPTAPWCDSVFRFTTLYILKEATYGHFPHPEFPLNPLQVKDPSHAAYSAVMGLLNRVTVPGAWPAALSNTYSPDESTVFQMIRDHRKKMLYVRHYGNMQWVSFDVQNLAGAKPFGVAPESADLQMSRTSGATRTMSSEIPSEYDSEVNLHLESAVDPGQAAAAADTGAAAAAAAGAGIRIASINKIMPVDQPWAVDMSSRFRAMSTIAA